MKEFFHYFFGKGETVEFRDFSFAHSSGWSIRWAISPFSI